MLGIALLTTLYKSLSATLVSADMVGWVTKTGLDMSWQNQVANWWQAGGLLWVPTFACLVLGRVVAARVLVLIALAYEFGVAAWMVIWRYIPARGG